MRLIRSFQFFYAESFLWKMFGLLFRSGYLPRCKHSDWQVMLSCLLHHVWSLKWTQQCNLDDAESHQDWVSLSLPAFCTLWCSYVIGWTKYPWDWTHTQRLKHTSMALQIHKRSNIIGYMSFNCEKFNSLTRCMCVSLCCHYIPQYL